MRGADRDVTAIRRILVSIALAAALGVCAACARPQSQSAGTGTPAAGANSATPAPAASALAEATGAAETGAPQPESAEPAETPVPNLLEVARGTIARAYSPAINDPAGAVDGFHVQDNDAGPWTFVYELPGVATLARASAKLAAKTDKGDGATVAFAVSTTSATSGFADVATIAAGATGEEQSASLPAPRARWVRVTVSRTGAAPAPDAFAVYGTLAQGSAAIAGTYVQSDQPYANGAFASAPSNADALHLQVATLGPGGANGVICTGDHVADAFPGTFDGRVWTWNRSGASGTFVANDDGTLLVGVGSEPTYWLRTTQRPKFCAPIAFGSGRNRVLLLEPIAWNSVYPANAVAIADVPATRIDQMSAAILDRSMLDGASAVWLNSLCDTRDAVSAAEGTAIAQWVAAGHKLLITDSDACTHTHYAFLPYTFASDNPGAKGAKGDRLIQVEDDALGTSDTTDKAHFFDPQPWAKGLNELGDANTVTTHDPHWCGHLFGTNANRVNGFMQMYAPYGTGVIIYDGFDDDDHDNAGYRRVRGLELALPAAPDVPCTRSASLAFVVEPDRDGKFAPGAAATLPFTMELLANQGWKGHVTLTTTGNFPATVTPSSFDVAGGTQPLAIAVHIPPSAKPGVYAVIVNGDGGGGQTAQATIHLHADVSMIKQLKTQRRIRIYGIHFDVDKATIKPQSEPVIAQIAQLMRSNPAWRFRVEGHTDSDGGLAHNATLSQNRAQSVVNDLVKRYRVARSRLVPKGFGYSKPVAPNTTAAGKALNRRVELYLLNP